MLPETNKAADFYQSFEEFCKKIFQLKISNIWSIKIVNNLAHIYKEDDDHQLNHTDIYVDESLSFTIDAILRYRNYAELSDFSLSNAISTSIKHG